MPSGTVPGKDPSFHDELSDPMYKLKMSQFEKFKNLVVSRHNPAYFSDAQDLAHKVDKSLLAVYRSGVANLLKRNSELSEKVGQLESEIRRLQTNTGIGTLPNTPPTPQEPNSWMDLLGKKF